MRRRLKERFVAWDAVAGMEDPERFKQEYAVLLGKGRPIILSHDAAARFEGSLPLYDRSLSFEVRPGVVQ